MQFLWTAVMEVFLYKLIICYFLIHIGICYGCSLEIWKMTNECYLCRNVIYYQMHSLIMLFHQKQKISQVLQVDLISAKFNIIKVISSTQRVQLYGIIIYHERLIISKISDILDISEDFIFQFLALHPSLKIINFLSLLDEYFQ